MARLTKNTVIHTVDTLKRLAQKRKSTYSCENYVSQKTMDKLNEICLMFFELGNNIKPTYTSIRNFAKTNPTKKEIEVYLNNEEIQNHFSEFKLIKNF